MALFAKRKDIFLDRNTRTNSQNKQIHQEPVVEERPPEKKDTGLISVPKNSALISDCMNTKGLMSGCGSLIIKGQHEGNVSMKETVIISKEGSLVGKIEASKIKISGNVKGVIKCHLLEITKGSKFEGEIYSTMSYINGEAFGEFYATQSIEVDSDGRVKARECKSKVIKVTGKLKGKVVASEMLEVIRGGSIDGEIVTKGIKTMDGGSVVGTIVTYNEKIHTDKPKKSDGSKDAESGNTQATHTPHHRDIDPKLGEIIKADQIDVTKYAPKKEDDE